MTETAKSDRGVGSRNRFTESVCSTLYSTPEHSQAPVDTGQAIAHLEAVGFKPGDTVWMRLWLPKHTPIELAKRLKLAYQDKQGASWRLSVINGFLSLEEGQKATFTQVFGDKGKKLYPNAWQQLQSWNRQGFGVGFIPNRGGKKDVEITECWCLFYEVDDRSFEEQMDALRSLETELGQQATFVLKTRKSLHCWFRLNEKVDPKTWRIYQQRLAQYQQSDSSLHDPSQVMRLAGFWHQSVDSESTNLWKGLQEATLPEGYTDVTESSVLANIWDSVAVYVVQNTGNVFALDTFDCILPLIDIESGNMRYKEFERSFPFPHSEAIPLEICLSRKNREALDRGHNEGNRNQLGFALACDLLGVADYLIQEGQPFLGNPHTLFLAYCDRCNPPLPETERASIWQSAEKEVRNAALDPQCLRKCIIGYVWRQMKGKRPSPESSDSANGELEAESDKKPTIAQLLLEIAETATYFHTPDRKVYADVLVNGIRKTFPMRQKSFKQWLQYELFKQHQKTAGSEALSQVLGVIEAKANFEGEERETYLRIAEHKGKVYLDLGTEDWTAIEITSTGWQVVSDYPVRFRRPDTLLPLPIPEAGGNLTELRQLLNLDQDIWILTVSWLLFSFYPKYPHPILILHGEQGSGKSYTARVLKALIDPGKAPLILNIADLRNLAIAAENRLVLAYDNLSGLGVQQSDALCRISTGGGFSTRSLFENDEETVFEFIRPQILTGIDSLASRGDLLERSLMVKLPTIPEEQRATEAKLEAELTRLQGRILGALLTALSQTLKNLPQTNPSRLPRMADFARFAIAAETALDLPVGSFLQVYLGNRQEAQETALEASPVAIAIQRFMESRQQWQGTATNLLEELEKLVDEKTLTSKAWAGDSRKLGKALTRLAPDLRGIGIEVTTSRNNSSRVVRLERAAKLTSQMSLMSRFNRAGDSNSDIGGDQNVTQEAATVTGDKTNSEHSSGSSINVTPNVTPRNALACIIHDH